MTPLERIWLVGMSLIAMLALVLGCVNFALAQQRSMTPEEIAIYAGSLLNSRNQCEADRAIIAAERDALKRQIEDMKKKAEEKK